MNVRKRGALAALLAAGGDRRRHRRERRRRPRAAGEADRDRLGRSTGRATWRRSTSRRSRPRKVEVAADQRQGRREGSSARDHDLRHPGQQARRREVVRREPGRPGRDIIFTTCDVDFATPVVQEAINAGKLAIAPCIGTDQMGPKRFGAKGKLAFSFGNVAQDEGSAMAQ